MAVAVLDLEAFVGVVGGFNTASNFVVLARAGDALSFLSSEREDNSKRGHTFFKYD